MSRAKRLLVDGVEFNMNSPLNFKSSRLVKIQEWQVVWPISTDSFTLFVEVVIQLFKYYFALDLLDVQNRIHCYGRIVLVCSNEGT